MLMLSITEWSHIWRIQKSLIYTSLIRLCAFASGRGSTLMADFELMQALATNHEALSVSHSVGSNGTDVLTFKLPSSVQEMEQTIMENVFCAENETILRPGI